MNRLKLSAVLATVLVSGTAVAQHPHPQPYPVNPATGMPGSVQVRSTDANGNPYWNVTTFSALPQDQNFLLTVDSNIFTSKGVEIPNTEPSTPANPFNLINGQVNASDVDMTSPRDDLDQIISVIASNPNKGLPNSKLMQFAIDILEGNPIPSRPTYSGMALLHYTGPERIKQVQPIYDANGKLVGGNVNIHQAWFDNHIESDTALLDPSAVLTVPWTVTYTIDVLHRGADDFATMVMYMNDPPLDANGNPISGKLGMPNVAMDTTFYPMEEGKRYVLQLKMAPAEYYNLTYTWGWRIHPPRVQVNEVSTKVMGGKTLAQWEIDTFGVAPRSSAQSKAAAIAMIGELSPAKLMWAAFQGALNAHTPKQIAAFMSQARAALDDWSDRTHLPAGVRADPNADATLFYVNNTIYGNVVDFAKWTERGTTYKVTLLNGDHFMHSYMNVDFGGARGWENQFQSGYNDNPALAKSTGCTFTFGRTHWWINAGGPWGLINIAPVSASGQLGTTRAEIHLNFEPSARLRLYQFDPLHHEEAIYSLH